MARPRDFDEPTVIGAATDCFWQHGYTATSVRDLATAMGLGSASLYNAFGDKGELFAKCLDQYLTENFRARVEDLERSMNPRDAIEAFFSTIVESSLVDPRGCLLVNTALEVAPHDPCAGAVIAGWLQELEDFFCRLAVAGQSQGNISAARSPRDLARLLLTSVLGLRVLGRVRQDPMLLRGIARETLRFLDPSQVNAGT